MVTVLVTEVTLGSQQFAGVELPVPVTHFWGDGAEQHSGFESNVK
jgi:hypothetical protein